MATVVGMVSAAIESGRLWWDCPRSCCDPWRIGKVIEEVTVATPRDSKSHHKAQQGEQTRSRACDDDIRHTRCNPHPRPPDRQGAGAPEQAAKANSAARRPVPALLCMCRRVPATHYTCCGRAQAGECKPCRSEEPSPLGWLRNPVDVRECQCRCALYVALVLL